MIRICHVFDGGAGWEQRIGVSQLLDRLPTDRFGQMAASLSPASGLDLAAKARPIFQVHAPLPWTALFAPPLRRFVELNQIDVLHAWGIRGASAACATMPDRSSDTVAGSNGRAVVLTLFDPRVATRHIKLLRTLAARAGFAVACGSAIVRRRLIEGGFPPDSAVVIRPGVDFARINELRRRGAREQLGLARSDYVVIVPEPVSRDDGAIDAALAVVFLNHGHGGFRLILPGRSRERDRIIRLIQQLPSPSPLVDSAPDTPYEQLLCAADALVAAPRADVSTTAIAWAMAADVAVVGSAVHSVAELIANKVNGLLFKQVPGKGMAVSVAKLLQDGTSQTKMKEAARGQAYEVFGLRRCVEDHIRLYDNLREGRSANDGIVDPAMTG